MFTDLERLILVGQNENLNNEKFSRKFLYSLPAHPKVLSMGFYDLLNLIKGLAMLELDQDKYAFGSTTSVGKLMQIIKAIKIDNGQPVTDLINWLFSHRNNSYIPFGFDIPLEVKSIKDYQEYENKKDKHRMEMAMVDKQRSREAKIKKATIIKNHEDLAEIKNLERLKIVKRLKRLTAKSRIKFIIESNQQINYFPEQFAEMSGIEFEKITDELLSALITKLDYAKSNSAWHRLIPVIKARLIHPD